MYNKFIIFLFVISSIRISGIISNIQTEAFLFTKQDRLRIQLSRFNKFQVLGKDECATLINKWKQENMIDKEYRIILDKGMRQLCDKNIFPLFINRKNSEYIIINLVSDDNINIINILDNKQNTWSIDKAIMEYHIFLVENNYNPNYYELKESNMKHFLNIFILNLLSEEENKLIYFKKNNYIKFLEKDTEIKNRD
tara:strand:+ start:582 stop:1169 length:588 start_codon:yes stop_codon:yes gene_type:complete